MFENINTVLNTGGNHTILSISASILGAFLPALILSGYLKAKKEGSKSFRFALVLLPVAVSMVIILVNGNVGTGVAVMGAFSLVRFRSVAGTAREMTYIFLAMAIGLAAGTGYIAAALVFVAIVLVIIMLTDLLEAKSHIEKMLKITIPENLDNEEVINGIIKKHTVFNEFQEIRSAQMGGAYRLCWKVHLKDESKQKLLLDDLRCINGNMEVSLSRSMNEESI